MPTGAFGARRRSLSSATARRGYGIPKALLKDSAQLVVEPAGGLAAAGSVAPARVRVSEVADPHPISMPVPLDAKEATLWPVWKLVPTAVVAGSICSATYQ